MSGRLDIVTLDAAYSNAIRGAVRGFWLGIFDYDQFFESMMAAIRLHIPKAWYSGAADCGIMPADLSPEERVEIERNVTFEYQFINGFALAIEEGSKANGGRLGSLFARADVWIGRWEGIQSKARTMACADEKLEWVLGPTERPCSSCQKLSGKVKRGSYWDKKGVLPRVRGAVYLICKGFGSCELLPTDKPLSRGPLPKLP